MFAVVGVAAAGRELDRIGQMVVDIGEDSLLLVRGIDVVEGDESSQVFVGAQDLLDGGPAKPGEDLGRQIRVDHVGVVVLARAVIEAADDPGEASHRVRRGEPDFL